MCATALVGIFNVSLRTQIQKKKKSILMTTIRNKVDLLMPKGVLLNKANEEKRNFSFPKKLIHFSRFVCILRWHLALHILRWSILLKIMLIFDPFFVLFNDVNIDVWWKFFLYFIIKLFQLFVFWYIFVHQKTVNF